MRIVRGRFGLLKEFISELTELIGSTDQRLSPNLQMFISSFAKRKPTLSKEEFKSIRKQSGLTQEALAEVLNFSPIYVSYLENGRRQITPELEQTMRNLAKAKGIAIQDLKLKEAS